jgi:hypothetical protein
MAPEYVASLEGEQKVLSDRFDSEQAPSVQPLGRAGDGRPRVRGLHLDEVADKRLEASGGTVQRVSLRHPARIGRVWARSAAAGAAAALVWGAQEPLDQRIFRCDYSDIALLGKAVTRGRSWRAAGFAVHVTNGAVFGLAFEATRRRLPFAPRRIAVGLALAEHVALYPLGSLVDRYHPARGEPGVPPLRHSRRAYAQASWRHLLFGWVLGRLAA